MSMPLFLRVLLAIGVLYLILFSRMEERRDRREPREENPVRRWLRASATTRGSFDRRKKGARGHLRLHPRGRLPNRLGIGIAGDARKSAQCLAQVAYAADGVMMCGPSPKVGLAAETL